MLSRIHRVNENLVNLKPTVANLVIWLVIVATGFAAYFAGNVLWSFIAKTYFS